MKKMKFKVLIALMSILAVGFVSSCKEDDPVVEPVSNIPVLDEDFAFTVVNNDVNFTTSLIGNVWFKNETSGTEYVVADGVVSVNLPKMGSYPFTCNTLIEGETFTSDTFIVAILQDDLSFLESGLWKALTGGTAGYNKSWRLDDFTSQDGVNFCKYFKGSIGYVSPDDLKCNGILKTNAQWADWSGDYPSFFDGVQDLPEDATISFDGATGKVKLAMTKGIKTNGAGEASEYWTETVEGAFSLEVVDTVDFEEVNIQSVSAQSGGTYGDQAASVSFSSPLRFPIDMGLMIDGAFDDEVLQDGFKILSCTDSAMVVFAWRQYSGGEPNVWGHLFFFICDDYTYSSEQFTYSEPIKTSFTAADLVGTWKYADVAQDWISWDALGDKGTVINAACLNAWATRADMITTLSSWNGSDVTETFTTNDANEYVFNSDGTCTLAGIANTYSVSNGVIAFGTELTTEFQVVFITLTGTTVTIADPKEGTGYDVGIWLGQRNGDKTEYSCVHLVKQ